MIVFDSDLLELCLCGHPSLLVEFLAGGDWRIRCPGCGYYWPSQGEPDKNPMVSLVT